MQQQREQGLSGSDWESLANAFSESNPTTRANSVRGVIKNLIQEGKGTALEATIHEFTQYTQEVRQGS